MIEAGGVAAEVLRPSGLYGGAYGALC